MFQRFFQTVKRHKVVTGLVIIILIVASYYGYKSWTGGSVTSTSYILGTAAKGTLITSVSGSGQVSAASQVDIKPKASGDILSLAAVAGQEVKGGTVLAWLDSSDAQKTVRDAESSLESAKLSLEKLQQPADTLSLLQAEDALTQAKQAKQNAEDDLAKAYEDGFTKVANAFLDLPTVMAGLQTILFDDSIVSNQTNIDYYTDITAKYDNKAYTFKASANNSYQKARIEYDATFNNYKSTSRFSDNATIEALIEEAYNTSKDIAEAVKDANNLIQFYKDKLTEHDLTPQTAASAHLASLDTYTGTTNTHISTLLLATQTIDTDKETITSSDRTIVEKTQSLADLKAGTDPLDIKSQQLSIQQKGNALADAREKLADYSVRAPFDGVLASVDVKKGDAVSASTTVATIITKQKIAEVSLNEVDVAKVKVGQKATLTFDAVSDLTITGQVAEVDTIGTVSQGVVNYSVKISFDTDNDNIKPGMSVSASIITDTKQDVLLIPSSAVKSSSQGSYVLMPNESVSASAADSSSGVVLANTPREQSIEVGLSDDSNTEITSGLKEGDQVIVRTISSTSASSSSTSGSNKSSSSSGNIFRALDGGGPPHYIFLY